MQREMERQVFHLVFGTAIAVLILFLGRFYSLALFGLCIITGIFISEVMHQGIRLPVFYWFIRRMERDKVKPGQGTLNFLLGIFIALVFFSIDIVFVSVLILAFADSFSTVVGKGIGSRRIYNKKSIEGFIAAFLASFLVTLPYLGAYVGLITCFMASLTELLTPVDDNIVIPPLASLIIYMLTL
jgi:dolichol kinase